MKSQKVLTKIATDLEQRLREDILLRYHNSEYWDPDILDEALSGLKEKEQEEVLKILETLSDKI